MPDIAALEAAIRRMHGCLCKHVETVHIVEPSEDGSRTLWEGDVAVFDLQDFPRAARCYAWAGIREGQFVVILHGEKIESPRGAVRSRLILGSKRHD